MKRLTLILAFLIAGTAFGALSQQYAEWGNGPAKWLMTSDDEREWKKIKTDEEAANFIALFWARRDPTPGTPLNEFRREFEARVRYADANYQTGKKRGSLTEPGRVYVLLGPPKGAGNYASERTGATSALGSTVGGGRQLGAKIVFEYDRPAEMKLTGPIMFIEDLATREFGIDFQVGNPGGALRFAVDKAIVNANLTAVPEWAKETGAQMVRSRVVDEKTPAQKPSTTLVTSKGAPAPPPPAAQPVKPAGQLGAHHLMLVANSRIIKPQADGDPFAGVQKKSTFTITDDLGFALQYCRASVDASRPELKLAITISGTSAGQPVNFQIPEDDTVAEPVKTMPGCYVVRGALPLEALEAGSWTFGVKVTDPESGGSYNLSEQFTVN